MSLAQVEKREWAYFREKRSNLNRVKNTPAILTLIIASNRMQFAVAAIVE